MQQHAPSLGEVLWVLAIIAAGVIIGIGGDSERAMIVSNLVAFTVALGGPWLVRRVRGHRPTA